MDKATNDKVLELIKDVKRRKEELGRIERPAWRTNCSFSYIEGSASTFNIQVLNSVSDLVKIHAFLIEKKKAYDESAKVLEVNSLPKFQWNGFSFEDWTEDIRMRINKIQIGSKRKKLEEIETRLNAIVSPELRAQMELEAISEELGG